MSLKTLTFQRLIFEIAIFGIREKPVNLPQKRIILCCDRAVFGGIDHPTVHNSADQRYIDKLKLANLISVSGNLPTRGGGLPPHQCSSLFDNLLHLVRFPSGAGSPILFKAAKGYVLENTCFYLHLGIVTTTPFAFPAQAGLRDGYQTDCPRSRRMNPKSQKSTSKMQNT